MRYITEREHVNLIHFKLDYMVQFAFDDQLEFTSFLSSIKRLNGVRGNAKQLTWISCGFVQRCSADIAPPGRPNRNVDPARIWPRPVQTPPATWRYSTNGVVLFDSGTVGCEARVQSVYHPWNCCDFRSLERRVALPWNLPMLAATEIHKKKMKRFRE